MAVSGKKQEKEQLLRCQELKAILKSRPAGADELEFLSGLLTDKRAMSCHRGARLVRQFTLSELQEPLLKSLEQSLSWGVQKDPGCLAKTELARAVVSLELDATELYRRGLKLVQLEPVWGGSKDTAAGLRVACAAGLVQSGAADVLDDLAQLLADPEAEARRGAARALADMGNPLVTPLLRLKALLPEADPESHKECLSALLACGGADLIPFVCRWLKPMDPDNCQLAAMALCEMGSDQALKPVIECAQKNMDIQLLEILLLTLAGSNLPDARDYLVQLALEGREERVKAALLALHPLRQDPEISRLLKEHFNDGSAEGADEWTRLFNEDDWS